MEENGKNEVRKTSSNAKKTTQKKETTFNKPVKKKTSTSKVVDEKSASKSKKPTLNNKKSVSSSLKKDAGTPKENITKIKKTSSIKPKTITSTVSKKKPVSNKKTAVKSLDTESVVNNELNSSTLLEESTPTVMVSPIQDSPTKRKYTPRKKPDKRMTEEIEEVLRKGTPAPIQKVKKKKGRVFYLVFTIIFYATAYYYINTVLYDNQDHLQSALFAFAALFVVFVLLQFNVHMILINFFRLPFNYILNESKLEISHQTDLTNQEEKSKFPWIRYKAIFTLTLYAVISLLLVGSQIYNGIMDGDKVVLIITQSSITLLVFLIIVCSWQYLFNILPKVLDKSIDAKNGFILTLSAAVMVIYVIFLIFDIAYLAEMMIFILIVGFVALLGVNLNMIVGEINIFQNLKTKHSKTVSRVVFLIFFSFHLYVILYASVVAYSIYIWVPESYNFAYPTYETIIVDTVFDFSGNEIDQVYDSLGNPITEVYNETGTLMTEFYNPETKIFYPVYTETGDLIEHFYDANSDMIFEVYNELNEPIYEFGFDGTSLATSTEVIRDHDYGDFLYYTVVTVSTLGYGDISPSTDYNIAQAWGGFLSIYGFTFFALSISFVSQIAMEGNSLNREDENDD